MYDPATEWVNAAIKSIPAETYVMIRPVELHQARGTVCLPTIAFRREGDSDDNVQFYTPTNHIEPLVFGLKESFDEELGRPVAKIVEFEWRYIPGYSLSECSV
jgi:hypothetical protein